MSFLFQPVLWPIDPQSLDQGLPGVFGMYGSVNEALGCAIKGANKALFILPHFFFPHGLGIRGIFNFSPVQYLYRSLGL